MTYRDDRDALHARNEALEQEVLALRAQNALAVRTIEQLRNGEPEDIEPPAPGQQIHLRSVGVMITAAALVFSAVYGMRAYQATQDIAPAPIHAIE